jgi:hypothetical protein
MTNRYPGPCARCGGRVWAGDGEAAREGDRWVVRHAECARAEREQAEQAERAARVEAMKDDDDRAYEAWEVEVARLVREAFAAATHLATRQDGACYYDFSTYRMTLDAPVDARTIRRVLGERDGHSMAAYGAAGGYTTQGDVTLETPGVWIIERVYHHGD